MNEADQRRRLTENLVEVRGRMAAAALRAGRRPEEVRLVGVTKYVSPQSARWLCEAGCPDLAENRPQELWHKAAALGDLPVRWHLIGHLQRNKVRRTLPLVQLIHSVDSERLLQEIAAAAAEAGRPSELLLEVNVSGDAAKHGLAPTELPAVLAAVGELPQVRLRGLMCMAGLDSDAEQTRREFASLRELRDRWRHESSAGETLEELSMGMSGDFELAIEEGATLVRIGSRLFEGVEA